MNFVLNDASEVARSKSATVNIRKATVNNTIAGNIGLPLGDSGS